MTNPIPIPVIDSLRVAAEYYNETKEKLENVKKMKRHAGLHKQNITIAAHNAANAVESLRLALDTFSVQTHAAHADATSVFLQSTSAHVTIAIEHITAIETTADESLREYTAQLAAFDGITKDQSCLPTCPVCHEQSSSVMASQQCGHLVCSECKDKLRIRPGTYHPCPVCRGTVYTYIRVFF